MEGDFANIAAYLFLFFLIFAAIVLVWDELFEPPISELLDDKPWKQSGSYWADCMRRGDCYKCSKQNAKEREVCE